MTRIEEALRRAGGGGLSQPSKTRAGDVFVSPWAPSGAQPVEGETATRATSSELTIPRSPGVSGAWLDRLVVSETVDPLFKERFRRLATELHHAQVMNKTRIVLVASALPGEGKTLTSINLALALSELLHRRVLLIDADLRRPSIDAVWKISGVSGLSDHLRAWPQEKLALVQLTELLTLLPAGSPDPNPTSGLASPRMKQILEEAAEQFDWIVLDSPPLEAVSDANLLVSMVDAALLVVRVGLAPCKAVQSAVNTLGRERVLGVVLNGVERADLADYAVYYNTGSSV